MARTKEDVWADFERETRDQGLALSGRQISLLKRYTGLIQQWNSRVRLVSDPSTETLVERHILDSLTCAGVPCVRKAKSLVDVGSGAGLPGIPIAIALGLRVTLLEAVTKKAAFLSFTTETLGLSNLSVVVGRAEDQGHGTLREAFDASVSRGVAPLAVLLEYCLPLTKKGGCAVAQKGRPSEEELSRGAAASKILGGGTPEVVTLEPRAGATNRALVVVAKEAPTDNRFPRRAGMPAKRPLGEQATK